MALQAETQTKVEGKSRKRLKPLLQKLLNDNIVPELCWRDKGRQIWQMPWKCHKQTRWGDADALMLREFAKGMYNYEGADEPAKERLKQWKELLRNALRSLKDVKELKDLHVVDGERPYKVYQFVTGAEGARRCRGTTVCQAGDTDRHNQRMPAAAVEYNHSHESFSNSMNLPNLHELASSHQAPPATISSQSPFCGIVFQGKSSQLINIHSTRNEGHNVLSTSDEGHYVHSTSNEGHNVHSTSNEASHILSLQHQCPPLAEQFVPVDEESDLFPGSLADTYDDDTLNKLMSEFILDNFRSRSPLRHDNGVEADMDLHEISVKDVEVLNNGPQTTTGMCDSAVTTTVPSQPEMSFYDMDQPCTVANIFPEATPQNMAGNDDHSNTVSPGLHVASGDVWNRLRNMGNTAIRDVSLESRIQNMAVQNQPFLIGNEILSAMNPRCVPRPYVGDKPMLTGEVDQERYPSINSILSNAPVSSVIVVVYYNTFQVVKWQSFTTTFRICFVPDDQIRESIRTCLDPKQFGPTDVNLCELPEIRKNTKLSLEARDTNKILTNLTRGVIVDLRGRNIYATRYCKAVPQFCTPGKTEFTKMERYQEVKIFDFHDYIRQSFDPQYRYQNTNPFVRLSFAVKDANRRASALSVDIWHTEAYLTKLRRSENAHSLEADCSLSDEYDRRVEIEQLIKETILHF